MYDIGIVTRSNESQWGGDLRALYTIRDGMREEGVSVKLAAEASGLADCNFIFLSNTCLDQTSNFQATRSMKKQHGIIGFHEDFLSYFGYMMGFTKSVTAILEHNNSQQLSVDIMKNNPDVIGYFSQPPPPIQLTNQHILRSSELCVANSRFEENTMVRDCHDANTCSVHWTTGTTDLWKDTEPDESFLDLTGLEQHGYILQVGRIETRKNQLMTALACEDLGLPVVFVATRGYQEWYTKILRDLCRRRNIETYIVSEEYKTQRSGSVRVINMPNGKKLPINTLRSAMENAAVNVGPAFHELPGYTYLESLSLGCPTVASSWTSCKEYLQYKRGCGHAGGLIKYCKPYDIIDVQEATRKFIEKPPKRKRPRNKIFKRTPREVGAEIIHHLNQAIG